jgi:hypothetical protein
MTYPQQPFIELGLSGDRLAEIGVLEARKLIRGLNYKQYGLASTDVSNMTADECRVFLASGEAPERLRKPEPIADRATDRPDPMTPADKARDAIRALEQALSLDGANVRDSVEKEVTARLEALRESLLSEIREKIETLAPRRTVIDVTANGKTVTVETLQHHKFPLVLRAMSCRGVNVALVGPAGSGKSRLASEAAKALTLDYSPVSFNILSSKADVLGFVDAHGAYHSSAFRDRFACGGVFVADEFDAAHAGIATILNAAVANRECTFGDNVTVPAHAEFRFVACMNTYGTGATAEYVGRNRLDAATLDRFAYIDVDYDEHLESALVGAKNGKPIELDLEAGGIPDADSWLKTVRDARRCCATENIKAIISPRAVIMGVSLAAAGIGAKHLKDMLLLRGLNEIDRPKLTAAIG